MDFCIIAIHGTFAADAKLRGQKWWQTDSQFSTRVLSYLNTKEHRIQWVPFGWSGANSQRARHIAASALKSSIDALSASYDKNIVCIAHSHGGNVADFAMRSLSRDKVRLVTIGTPFFKSGLDSPARLWIAVGKSVLLAIIVAMAAIYLTPYFKEPVREIIFYFLAATAILVTIPALECISNANLPIFRKRGDNSAGNRPAFLRLASWINPQRPKFERSFAVYLADNRRTPKLYSALDEAINSLQAAPRQKVSIATKSFVATPTIVFVGCLVYIFFRAGESKWRDALSPIMDFVLPPFQQILDGQVSGAGAQFVVLNFLMVFVALLVGFGVCHLGGSWLFAGSLNALFKASALSKAYGDDRNEGIGWASANEDMLPSSQDWKPLPRELEVSIENVTKDEAHKTMKFARDALGLAAISGVHDLVEAIVGSLGEKELIHTAYFDADRFTEFLVWILVTKCGIPPGEKFNTIDSNQCERWFEEIAPTARVRAEEGG